MHTAVHEEPGDVKVPAQQQGVDNPADQQNQRNDRDGVRKEHQSVLLCGKSSRGGIPQRNDEVDDKDTGINLTEYFFQNTGLS